MTPTRRKVLAMTGATIAAAQILAGGGAKASATGDKIKAIGFDAFTIFDPRSIQARVEDVFPGRGNEIMSAWRSRIFEYSWLRTLNRSYVDFRQITHDALVFALKSVKIDADAEIMDKVQSGFLDLKPWPDTVDALKAMRAAGIRLAYLSNFTPQMLKTNSEKAGIADLFEHMFSTDLVQAYKPDPRAYAMAPSGFNLPRKHIAFAAFGGWDAAGAKSFGYDTFWVNRMNAPVEELGVKPDGVGATLTDLAAYVTAHTSPPTRHPRT